MEKKILVNKQCFALYVSIFRVELQLLKRLHKIQKFHLISRRGNLWKLCGNNAFPQNFSTRKLDEVTVFYAVKNDFTVW